MKQENNDEPLQFPVPDHTSQQTTIIKKGRKKKGRVYYLEDFAGLWVYIQVGEEAKLLTPYPFNRSADKNEIKALIDKF